MYIILNDKLIQLSDLTTSDAIKLAKTADPEGKRTIGVLTKLDLMDSGTDARRILRGESELQLRMGYIAVVNRSQKDIDDKKDMKRALDDERKYFSEHSAYSDMSNRLGISYLQKYLNEELSKHISKLLPPLKHKFESELFEINERIEKMSFPLEESDKERALSEANELFRQNFEIAVGGKGWKLDLTKLSGGTKVNLLMNDSYPKQIDKLFYDENRLRREIATAIQNFYGIHLGIFTPDAVVRASIENQIGPIHYHINNQ